MSLKGKKISLFLDIDNENAIERIQSIYNKITISDIVNMALDNTLNLEMSLKKQLYKLIKTLNAENDYVQGLSHPNEFQNITFNKKRIQLSNLMKLMTVFGIDEIDSPEKKIKIDMLSGYSIELPSDWRVVNLEEAKKSRYVFVVECLNSDKYAIPKYVYFSKNDSVDEKIVVERIRKAFPEFQLVVDNQVELQYKLGYPKTLNNAINLEEYAASPKIGIFCVINSDELKERQDLGIVYEPPYGVFIYVDKISE